MQTTKFMHFNKKITVFVSFILTLVLIFMVVPINEQNAHVYAAESENDSLISDENDSIDSAIPITKFGKLNKITGKFESDTVPLDTKIFTAAAGAKNVDVDYYSIKLEHRAPIHINIGSIYISGSGIGYFGVAIIQPDKTTKNEILQISSDKAALDYTTNVYPPGTYYIALYTDDTTKSWRGSYELYVDRTADINSTYIFYSKKVYYTGSKINFIKTVTYNGDGTLLVNGQDYEVKYSGSNIEVGSGTITIKGKGGFTGTKILKDKYNILPNQIKIYKKKPTISSTRKVGRKLTIKWKAVKGANYYQIKYRVKGAKKWSSKTVKGTQTSLTLKKLKKGKKYQYKVRGLQKLSGYTTYYSKFSKTKTTKKIK